MNPSDQTSLQSLRSAMRQRRAALPSAVLGDHSLRVSRALWSLPFMARAQRIACYLAIDGEVDCQAFMATALKRKRHVHVPIIHGRRLLFAPWQAEQLTTRNHLGIAEPKLRRSECLSPDQLDVVLLPLVAFDHAGRRLGMGGGFYDRSFAFMQQRNQWQHPHLVGVAHDFQRVHSLPERSWDVDLHAAVTELATHHF